MAKTKGAQDDTMSQNRLRSYSPKLGPESPSSGLWRGDAPPGAPSRSVVDADPLSPPYVTDESFPSAVFSKKIMPACGNLPDSPGKIAHLLDTDPAQVGRKPGDVHTAQFSAISSPEVGTVAPGQAVDPGFFYGEPHPDAPRRSLDAATKLDSPSS